MRLSGKLLQHCLCLRSIGRLAIDAAGQDDLGVDAEYGPIARHSGDRPRLPLRVPLDLRDRIRAGHLLFIGRHDHLEWDRQLFQNRAPLRRPRCEQERRRRRRAHARLRARQSSSEGHFLAHSADTSS